MPEQWQIDQGKECPCGGADDYCPCQNTHRSEPSVPTSLDENQIQDLVYSAAEKAYNPEKHVLPEHIVSECVSAALTALSEVFDDSGPLYKQAARTIRNIIVF